MALVIASLRGGGAERVLAVLANAWAASGHEVSLVTLSSSEGDKYALDPRVRRVALGVAGTSSNPLSGIGNNFTRVRALRREISVSRPDVVISFIAKNNVLVLASLLGLGIPVIVSERTFPAAHGVHGVWRLLYRLLYPRAAAVVVQTHRSAADMGTLARKVAVIPNPVLPDCAVAVPSTSEPRASAGSRQRVLLAVGRLSHEKGFDLLIRAFARVADSQADWQLMILGEGALRADLTRMIDAAGLTRRITLPGFDPHVRFAMRHADLFALSSRFEGIPNVLLEAMAEGTACVSFDCDTGPRELIQHGKNGWLVPDGDVEALARALDALMRDADLRESLGLRAREVCTKYSLPKILEKWNAVVASTLPMAPQEPLRMVQR